MARAMILMKRDKLQKIYAERQLGVNYSALVRNHELPMTDPTLSKLLGHYDAYMETRIDEVRDIIHGSLFPVWLTESAETYVYQDTAKWVYRGVMPLGRWELRNDSAAVH